MPDFTGSRIDHVNVAVPDLARSLAFYAPVLETLGIVELLHVPANPRDDQLEMYGFGQAPKPFFWLVADGTVGTDLHLAFIAKDRAEFDAFMTSPSTSADDPCSPPGSAPSTSRTTTARSCSIPTASTSRRCVTTPSSREREGYSQVKRSPSKPRPTT